MPFRTVPLVELKRKVTFLYNKAQATSQGIDDDEYRTLEAMENELNRRGFELVEKVIIRRNPCGGRKRKVRRVPR
jgi:hypothetical protein